MRLSAFLPATRLAAGRMFQPHCCMAVTLPDTAIGGLDIIDVEAVCKRARFFSKI
ncbi:hypothetical protein [Pseudomonas sp. 22 E 5]|uniref:Uncharacterized protein n=1 Tax=Pseudomonas salomonii TaxID=191391 RepID=A0A7Y8GHV1_9PSED|nr:hypothetical protein [Pseudomonas salomonii]NWF11149.1 hypothetical protein [Pseudomonas salomonii]CRM88985.1 hypothetical protein [Pseudomonas sp. 22 E 5]